MSELTNIETVENTISYFDEDTKTYYYGTDMVAPSLEIRNQILAIVIMEGVRSIGDEAFARCVKVSEIEIPAEIATIGFAAFSYCSALTTVRIYDGIRDIFNYAFYCCDELTTLYLPSSVHNIEHNAFAGCTSLATVYFDGDQDDWDSIEIGYENKPLIDADIVFANTK